MHSADDITRHHPVDPLDDPWVEGPPPAAPVEVVDADPTWRGQYALVAARVRAALGPGAVDVEHVGSTAVPGLPAKPVIDVDLTVPDSRDENAYVPALVTAGFRLVVRERSWHEHRCFSRDEERDTGLPRTNLHVWSPGCPEVLRHRLFRDWLRTHEDDRELYRAAKVAAAAETTADGGGVMAYNARKQAVLQAILDRVFVAHGLLPATSA